MYPVVRIDVKVPIFCLSRPGRAVITVIASDIDIFHFYAWSAFKPQDVEISCLGSQVIRGYQPINVEFASCSEVRRMTQR